MNDIDFPCPYCNQNLEAPPEMFGTVVDCPSCSKQIQVPQPAPVACTPPRLPVVESNWKNTSPQSFVSQAMSGAAYCRMPISQIPGIVLELSEQLLEKGVSSSELTQFLHDTLFGICPDCQQSCSGGFLLSVEVLSQIGGENIRFMTDIGGGPKQRLMGGQCGNSRCSNHGYYEMFFCADLNREMVRYIDTTYHITYRPDNVDKRPRYLRPMREGTEPATTGDKASAIAELERQLVEARQDEAEARAALEGKESLETAQQKADAIKTQMTALEEILKPETLKEEIASLEKDLDKFHAAEGQALIDHYAAIRRAKGRERDLSDLHFRRRLLQMDTLPGKLFEMIGLTGVGKKARSRLAEFDKQVALWEKLHHLIESRDRLVANANILNTKEEKYQNKQEQEQVDNLINMVNVRLARSHADPMLPLLKW